MPKTSCGGEGQCAIEDIHETQRTGKLHVVIVVSKWPVFGHLAPRAILGCLFVCPGPEQDDRS